MGQCKALEPVKIQHSAWLAQPRQALGHRQLIKQGCLGSLHREHLRSAGANAGLVVLAFFPCFCPLPTSASTGLLCHARTTRAAPEPTVSYRSRSLAVTLHINKYKTRKWCRLQSSGRGASSCFRTCRGHAGFERARFAPPPPRHHSKLYAATLVWVSGLRALT